LTKYGRLILLILAVLAVGSLAACGGDDGGSSGPTVTATTGIWADVSERVAGDDAEVEQIIPDSSSPHDFQLSAQDRSEIEGSVLLVHNGADLEAGVPIDEIDVTEFAVADHVGGLLPFEEEGEHAEEEHAAEDEHAEEDPAGEEEHGTGDPHVWMDPARVAAALPAFADALAEADPEHAGGYRQRAQDYAAELRALDAEIRRTLAPIPPPDRKLVTSHDALGYFADRYDLEVVATPFPASGPEAEPSARTITEVEDAIVDSGVSAVFAEETDDPEVLRQIADTTGVNIEESLLVESPGDAGGYAEMLRRDADLIATALTGSDAR
jgi:ABC-type Zn uptake system ZnuABC Zn-binding protein ZnuA